MQTARPRASATVSWHTRRQVANLGQEPVLVGLDCEMCATQDDDRELLGLCLIDANGNVLVQVAAWAGAGPADCLSTSSGSCSGVLPVTSLLMTMATSLGMHGMNSVSQATITMG